MAGRRCASSKIFSIILPDKDLTVLFLLIVLNGSRKSFHFFSHSHLACCSHSLHFFIYLPPPSRTVSKSLHLPPGHGQPGLIGRPEAPPPPTKRVEFPRRHKKSLDWLQGRPAQILPSGKMARAARSGRGVARSRNNGRMASSYSHSHRMKPPPNVLTLKLSAKDYLAAMQAKYHAFATICVLLHDVSIVSIQPSKGGGILLFCYALVSPLTRTQKP